MSIPVSRKLFQCIPTSGMVIIAGGIGSGKSCLSYGILENYHLIKPGRALYVYNFPKKKANLLPEYIKPTSNAEFPEGAVVLADEAYFAFYAKDHSNELNRFMDQFSGLARQKDILTIFVTQSTRKLTLAAVSGVQAMLLKCPDIMMVRLDRPELRPMWKDVLEEFRGVPVRERQAATHVVSMDYEGLMVKSNRPPTFWSREISQAWEGVKIARTAKDVVAQADSKDRNMLLNLRRVQAHNSKIAKRKLRKRA